MKTKALLLLFFAAVLSASATFIQEVELKDGTVLSGYVYRQQPGKFIVFHTDSIVTSHNSKYGQKNKNYTLPWQEVKYIRRSAKAGASWCDDKVTLTNGSVYVGKIEEQELGVSLTIHCKNNGQKRTLYMEDIRKIEKIPSEIEDDIWADRQYTNQLLLTDKSLHEGLIVLQYRGKETDDCYVELLHHTGNKERIYLPEIVEYSIKLK